ncbi:MAG: hypothetical protein ABMB14_33325 [Myxococcota bacterium]
MVAEAAMTVNRQLPGSAHQLDGRAIPQPNCIQRWATAPLRDAIFELGRRDPLAAHVIVEIDRLGWHGATDGGGWTWATARYLAAGSGQATHSAATNARKAVAAALGARLVLVGRVGGAAERIRQLSRSPLRPDRRTLLLVTTGEQLFAIREVANLLREADAVRPNALVSRAPTHRRVVGTVNQDRRSVRCPCHDDRHPSMSIFTAADGAVLGKCHAAGCGALVRVEDDGTAILLRQEGAARPTHRQQRAPSAWRGTKRFRIEHTQTERFPQHQAKSIAPEFGTPAQRTAREMVADLERWGRPHTAWELETCGIRDRYRGIGFRVRTLSDRSDRGYWHRTWSGDGGSDRVMIDIDHTADLRNVDDHAMEHALSSAREEILRTFPWCTNAMIVRTSRCGLQVILHLSSTVLRESDLYTREGRAELRQAGSIVMQSLAAQGWTTPSTEIDESSWSPGRLLRACGLRLGDKVSDEPWLVRPLWYREIVDLVADP